MALDVEKKVSVPMKSPASTTLPELSIAIAFATLYVPPPIRVTHCSLPLASYLIRKIALYILLSNGTSNKIVSVNCPVTYMFPELSHTTSIPLSITGPAPCFVHKKFPLASNFVIKASIVVSILYRTVEPKVAVPINSPVTITFPEPSIAMPYPISVPVLPAPFTQTQFPELSYFAINIS